MSNNAKTLIKWPGGKAREIKYVEHLIPQYERYIEPFFGGGAMYFFLRPHNAAINDISKNLIDFYRLVKEQNNNFKFYLLSYCSLFDSLLRSCELQYDEILLVYQKYKQQGEDDEASYKHLEKITKIIVSLLDEKAKAALVFNLSKFEVQLSYNAWDKICRTKKNEEKSPFSDSDLKENLITGFASGLYLYFRDVYNELNTSLAMQTSLEYKIANFYFIRQYCYGAMFRYNSEGKFNIPYGGMSYNRKDFRSKVENVFSDDTAKIFSKTEIFCEDFEVFLSKIDLKETDFIFLDPPYDTDFSDYEGRAFTQEDQRRLAEFLKKTKAKFILIIKNTDFIFSLYSGHFNIYCFDKKYTYNVRSRNERNAEHLIVTNLVG